MPKKFGGNTKALEARERKEAAKNAEKERKEREAEEAMWRDDDKHVMRKQHRKVFCYYITFSIISYFLINRID